MTSSVNNTAPSDDSTMVGSDNILLSALLAMDAYNRGSNPKIALPSGASDEVGTKIANVTVLASTFNSDQEFYGIAYKVDNSNGDVIISYRGTDDVGLVGRLQGKDVVYGWPVGAGAIGGQAKLAEDFYDEVVNMDEDTTNTSVFDKAPTNISLTGHSLGGGLAGYIASISGAQATIFDNMPYQAAALYRVVNHDTAIGAYPVQIGWILDGVDLNGFAPIPSAAKTGYSANIQSISTAGEVLSYFRPLAQEFDPLFITNTYSKTYNAYTSNDLSLFDDAIFSVDADSIRTVLDPEPPDSSYDSGAEAATRALQNPVNLHSQALIVAMQYAQSAGYTGWLSVVGDFLNAFFSNSIAGSEGLNFVQNNITATSVPEGQMDAAIAYSVIDAPDGHGLSGTQVFGDTAIEAMFNGADDIGNALQNGGSPLLVGEEESEEGSR